MGINTYIYTYMYVCMSNDVAEVLHVQRIPPTWHDFQEKVKHTRPIYLLGMHGTSAYSGPLSLSLFHTITETATNLSRNNNNNK